MPEKGGSSMHTPDERPPTWEDIEAVLYHEWVEEQALLAVLEAMGELDEFDESDDWDELNGAYEVGEADEADEAEEVEEVETGEEDDFLLAAFALGAFLWDEHTWGDFSLNDLLAEDPSFRSA
jgi:hypothetical protein